MAIRKEPWVFYNKNRPKTESDLFDLQEQYLKNRDQKTWSAMLGICHDYARSMVLKRRKGSSYLEPDIVEDKATSAALAFMCQYLNNPKFIVGGSFAGMLHWKVTEALFKDSNEDNHNSFDDLVSENSNATLEDNQERAGFTNVLCNYDTYGVPEAVLDTENVSIIFDVLQELEDNLGMDIHSALLVYFYLIICLRKPKNRHAKKMFINQWTDFKSNRIIENVVLELRNRLKEIKN